MRKISILWITVLLFAFAQLLSASAVIGYQGKFEDKNITLNLSVRKGFGKYWRNGKSHSYSSQKITFLWKAKKNNINRVSILFQNKEYFFKNSTLTLKLKKLPENYFFVLKYFLSNGKKDMTQLFAQPGYLGSLGHRRGKLYVKTYRAFPSYENGYFFVFNPYRGYVTQYSEKKRKKIANLHIMDNGPDFWSSGMRRVIENKKYGYINKRNRIVILPQFDWAEPFRRKYAIVGNSCKKNKIGEHYQVKCKKYGVINKRGKILLPVIYESVNNSKSSRRFIVVKNGKRKTIKLKK